MNSIKFVTAQKSDADKIFCIYRDATENMNNQKIFQWDEIYPDKQTIYNDISNKQMTIGVINSETVSAYVLNHNCDSEYACGNWEYKGPQHLIIHRLCVNPKFQNTGIGTATMLHIEDYAKRLGYKSIRLDSFTQNPYACKMYEKLGYKTVGKVVFRKGEFYLMEKVL